MWKKILFGAAVGAGICVAVGLGVYLAGFTAAGVAAGSLAALIHSSIGVVAKSSLFASLQSAGATGAIFGSSGIFAGIGAAIGGFFGKKKKKVKKWRFF